MEYIDNFVAAVPTENRDAYIRLAKKAAVVFRKYGVLRYVECWGDDVPSGELTSFPQAVQCREDETVVAGWMAWRDKETRDQGMEQAMHDKAMDGMAQ